ncbi:cytochrome P450 93A3-like [Rutidosis leptorrhynchoides]|uniref:cytochrome P450 93A3-like n=1 Tax=Rutidosis leptorrhynchoides TaxID=125765 RepID=UPI003A99E00D
MADFQTYSIIFVIGTISIIFIRVLLKSTYAKSSNPPSPFALPVIGHLHLLGRKPHQVLHTLSNRYGAVFQLYFGSVRSVICTSPEAAKQVFKTYDTVFLNRPYSSGVDFITYDGNGFIFAPYGSYWKFLKRIVMSQLLNSKTLDSLLPVRYDEINHLIKYLSQKAKEGKFVELESELMKMTNNIISRMLMSKRCSDEDDEAGDIRKILSDFAKIMGTFNLSDHIWFLKNIDLQGVGKRSKVIHERFDILIEKIITEREEARKRKEKTEVKDLLDILLDIAEDESMEIKLKRKQIKAFIFDIFGAGTDTSAVTIEWALAELINHPNIMKKAVDEIDFVVGKNRLVKESDIPNLPYLQAIIKESLRLHPTVPLISRESIEECTIGGYHFPSKTRIFFNVWGVGRDATYWKNPLEFRPERFAEMQLDVRGQDFELLPFGSGRRMCPGISLGLTVVHVTLGTLIQCFEWKAGKNGNLIDVDMEEGVGLTLPRANPLVCVPTARLDLSPLLM